MTGFWEAPKLKSRLNYAQSKRSIDFSKLHELHDEIIKDINWSERVEKPHAYEINDEDALHRSSSWETSIKARGHSFNFNKKVSRKKAMEIMERVNSKTENLADEKFEESKKVSMGTLLDNYDDADTINWYSIIKG
jgi:hypothetical protein